MSDQTDLPETFIQRLWNGFQWMSAIILGALILVLVAATWGPLQSPGAPVAFFGIATALFACVGVALSPKVFFRLPRWGKGVAYLAILPAFILVVVAAGGVREAYELTPEGAKAAAELRKDQAIQDATAAKRRAAEDARKAVESQLAELKAKDDQLKEIFEQQEACLSWGRELPSLNEAVRKGLHNPSSFEHVETRFIIPEEDRMNVLLTFRAENGFGAIRLGQLKAQMIPESCEIVQVGAAEQV